MYHDPALARGAKADPRPRSAVSGGVGLAGLAGMTAWVLAAHWFGMAGPYAALVNVVACALPMVVWSLVVDKVHRNPSTGIDWSLKRPWRETLDISVTKLTGLWLTWGAIAAIYALGRVWWDTRYANYPFAMQCFTVAAPALFVLSVPYVLWLDRKLIEPRDGAWALGAWAMGAEGWDAEAIFNHLRSWAVKAFFLAFMVAIVPPGFAEFVSIDPRAVLDDPVKLAMYCVTFMFVIDVAFATAGYILTFRPLDAHIRTANPYAAGWTAALICYPPFLLMGNGGPLDYHQGSADWSYWLGGAPWVLPVMGTVLVGLTAIYASATIAFGLRFSNLTHRGILTHGPYAWSRHPAYLSKNIFWWLSTMPFLATTGWHDAVRNAAVMACVSGVYYWRARTEERHLGGDPAYREYSAWMARNGVVPRLFARLR
ncbi:isoprenylcysteine carboxylmethyltransferase family protein [Sphingomonas sp. HF-S4]|uniref:Isoprenylcysteine carboxylmethyltransferase family protein n=1 Tax=Sphingomonas agrestis TaxID=3080540 RepID=A0ABU3Y9Q8_9SPHN|nr:isoprenylcysteine carboxylmethyltransferase family protein [Sphingomonas sp. HF-S4]MDV3457997.1 isoprenylcysteine carboxylmethyltransferase family protein [Sphingomonas sp. HF-S4]